jgi:hypothetical protein
VEEAAAEGGGDGFGAIGGAGFRHDAPNVVADGVDADAELRGDLLVAQAVGAEPENIELAAGEIV